MIPFKAVCRLVLVTAAVNATWIDIAWAESYDCLVEPMVVAEVGSPVQGVIEELLVDRSDTVKRGQPVAQLKSTVEQAQFNQAKARSAMVSEINAREADLKLARTNMERIKNLFEQSMIPMQQRDETVAELNVAEAALSQALANFRLQKHELSRAEALLDQRTIRSPIDGVVVQQTAFPGEFVYENPVLTIAQLDPLRIEVVLPARMFGQFSPGDTALVYPEIGAQEPLLAEVMVVDRLLDTRSGTYGVRLTLANPELTIPSGQKCRLEFNPEDIVAR